MSKKTIFKRIITDFIEKEITGIYPRDISIPLDSKKIISLVGIRRSGKSSLLFNLIDNLRKSNDPKNILYINFEDDRLFPLQVNDLDSLIDAYYELFPTKRNEKIYLFLDEVQVVEKWELFVRRIYDTLDVNIFITGSNAKLLTSEIATSLRGRTISFEVFPFSFKEYLGYKNIEINLDSSKSLSFIKNALEEYLVNGGFAETIDTEQHLARKIVSEYLDLIVYKDIADRYRITNSALLKHLNKYCFTNIATLLSVTKLFNEFKSQGFQVSKDTLYNYLSYLENAYALFTVPIYRHSIKEEQRNPKKIYAVDNSFKKIYDYAMGADISKLYENIVFLHLRRQTKEIYYFKEKQELDFYANFGSYAMLVNVAYDLEKQSTREREISGLVEAMNYFGLDKAYLVTKNENSIQKMDSKTIYIVPLYEFLLR